MTMSKEWMRPHGIFLLPRRSGSVRNTAIAHTVTAEYIYGLKNKVYIGILKLYFVLCRSIICCRRLEERSITTILMEYINTKIIWQEIFMRTVLIKNGLRIYHIFERDKGSCIFPLFVISMTIVSLHTRRVLNRISISSFPQSEQLRKRKRSPGACTSTVTKAFSTPRKRIIA